MDKYTSLKEKLASCKPVMIATAMTINNPMMLKAFTKADAVLIDKEHGLYGTEDITPLTSMCRSMGLPSVVRVEDSLYHLIAKAMDMGADGIMIPRVESLEQVKTAVEAMHFPPVGKTGFGGWGQFREGETLEEYEHGRQLYLQIESPKGLSIMEEIISKYGEYISAFIIGPNDYSFMMGIPRQLDHPLMIEEYNKVISICKKHNKSIGIYDWDLEHAIRDYKELRTNVFWVSTDLECMKIGFESIFDGFFSELR